jgi:hypothetical protein
VRCGGKTTSGICGDDAQAALLSLTTQSNFSASDAAREAHEKQDDAIKVLDRQMHHALEEKKFDEVAAFEMALDALKDRDLLARRADLLRDIHHGQMDKTTASKCTGE